MLLKRSQVETKSGRIQYGTSKLRGEDLFRTFNITRRNSYQAIKEEDPVVGKVRYSKIRKGKEKERWFER